MILLWLFLLCFSLFRPSCPRSSGAGCMLPGEVRVMYQPTFWFFFRFSTETDIFFAFGLGYCLFPLDGMFHLKFPPQWLQCHFLPVFIKSELRRRGQRVRPHDLSMDFPGASNMLSRILNVIIRILIGSKIRSVIHPIVLPSLAYH